MQDCNVLPMYVIPAGTYRTEGYPLVILSEDSRVVSSVFGYGYLDPGHESGFRIYERGETPWHGFTLDDKSKQVLAESVRHMRNPRPKAFPMIDTVDLR